jgi:hypothetical protein
MLYIQSQKSQEISNKIHYTNMVFQYHSFVGKPDSKGDIITPERIKEYWSASKLFLDCTEQEAIEQYSLVGIDSKTGIPLVDPLEGVTTGWDNPHTVNVYDSTDPDNPIIIESYDDCIVCPVNIDDYDLNGFTYEILDIETP